MIYDLNIPHEKAKAETYFNHLLDKKKRVEIKVKHQRRSISQNSYLHLILNAFGMNFGYTLEEVKQEFFKKKVNPDIFYDGQVGELEKIDRWRSTADLDKGEMTTAIDRFLNYSAKETGYALPEPSDLAWIAELEREIENNKVYL